MVSEEIKWDLSTQKEQKTMQGEQKWLMGFLSQSKDLPGNAAGASVSLHVHQRGRTRVISHHWPLTIASTGTRQIISPFVGVGG